MIKVYDVKMKKIDVLKEYVKEKKFYFITMFIVAITLKAIGFFGWFGFIIFMFTCVIYRLTDFFINPKWKELMFR